ncbi:hypothetical protein ACP70R_008911 [Stipagrostis hirtigluma subsp. patula]
MECTRKMGTVAGANDTGLGHKHDVGTVSAAVGMHDHWCEGHSPESTSAAGGVFAAHHGVGAGVSVYSSMGHAAGRGGHASGGPSLIRRRNIPPAQADGGNTVALHNAMSDGSSDHLAISTGRTSTVGFDHTGHHALLL